MIDIPSVRQQFPALQRARNGRAPIFLDGPGGTQVPQRVIDAIVHYLSSCNANHGGVFTTSMESDAILDDAHRAAADLLNAPSPDEIVFGQNMTSLTLHLSRAIGRTLRPGDEVIVTRLDHDANVTPWVLITRDAGANVRYIDIHPEDCTLELESFHKQLNSRTRLVAIGCASNATGTINDVKRIGVKAHEAGAKVFVDAVHYAPHGPIDVQAWNCDFLACSAYKFFGPHVGILWGKRDLLAELPAYKVRPASESLPGRWMTGTQNHEGLAGVAAAINYLAEIGAAQPTNKSKLPTLSGRCLDVHAGLAAIQEYETDLSRRMLAALVDRPRFKVWGITNANRLDQRVPTFALTLADRPAQQIAEHLAEREIYTWSGNMYALQLTEQLGLEDRGGILRVGLIHYNTAEEIARLMLALDELT